LINGWIKNLHHSKEINKEEKKTIGKDYKICKLLHKAENVREMPSIEKKKVVITAEIY